MTLMLRRLISHWWKEKRVSQRRSNKSCDSCGQPEVLCSTNISMSSNTPYPTNESCCHVFHTMQERTATKRWENEDRRKAATGEISNEDEVATRGILLGPCMRPNPVISKSRSLTKCKSNTEYQSALRHPWHSRNDSRVEVGDSRNCRRRISYHELFWNSKHRNKDWRQNEVNMIQKVLYRWPTLTKIDGGVLNLSDLGRDFYDIAGGESSTNTTEASHLINYLILPVRTLQTSIERVGKAHIHNGRSSNKWDV